MALEINRQTDKQTTHQNVRSTSTFFTHKKISSRERMFFIEQLALLLETGSDLYNSLSVLQQQSDNPHMKAMLLQICDDINTGKSFSSALSQHPEVFSATYISLIAASESGGYLQNILNHLLAMEKQRDELQTTLVSAATYPIFLMFFSVAVVIFILVVVFPKFTELFAAIHDELPASTLFLMDLSELLINDWWAIIPAFLGFIILCILWLKSTTGHYFLDNLKIRAPLINTIFIKLYLIQILRVLGLSIGHGVNLIDALEISKDVVKNRIFHDFIDQLITNVSDGRILASGFKDVSFIPPMVYQMINTGEQTGNLALVCNRTADFFQAELEKKLDFIKKIIEPVMLIIMGAIVGILVSSLILPIFKLSHAIH